MKNLIILLFSILISTTAFSQKAAIFNNGGVKILKDTLRFKTAKSVESGTIDPTAVATPGDQGSLYMGASALYLKGDNGTSTNWTILTPYAMPIMAKGSLVASNGAQNGEFTKCINGEIIVWDSSEDAGFRCATRTELLAYTVDTIAQYTLPHPATSLDLPNLALTITPTTTNPIKVEVHGALFMNTAGSTGSGFCYLDIYEGAYSTHIGVYTCAINSSSSNNISSLRCSGTMSTLDNVTSFVPGTPVTYNFRMRMSSSIVGHQCFLSTGTSNKLAVTAVQM